MAIQHMKRVFKHELEVLSSDKKALLIFLMGPVLVMVAFAAATTQIGGQEETLHLDFALVDEDHSRLSYDLAARFEESKYASIEYETDMATAKELFWDGKVEAIVVIHREFDHKIRNSFLYPEKSEKARIDLVVDNSVAIVPITVPLVLADAMKNFYMEDVPEAILPDLPAGQQISPDLVQQVISRLDPVFINVDLAYGSTMPFFNIAFPMLTPIVLFTFGLMMCGLSIVAERVRGTLPRLLKTPVRRSEIVIGKLLAYLIVAMWHSFVVLALSLIFGLVVKGGVLALFVALFLTSYTGCTWGLFYSTFCKNERQVLDLKSDTFIVLFILGGVVIPVSSMPPAMQIVADALPLSHSVAALRSITTKGLAFQYVIGDLIHMLIFGTATLALALVSFKLMKE